VAAPAAAFLLLRLPSLAFSSFSSPQGDENPSNTANGALRFICLPIIKGDQLDASLAAWWRKSGLVCKSFVLSYRLPLSILLSWHRCGVSSFYCLYVVERRIPVRISFLVFSFRLGNIIIATHNDTEGEASSDQQNDFDWFSGCPMSHCFRVIMARRIQKIGVPGSFPRRFSKFYGSSVKNKSIDLTDTRLTYRD
jgi:hypothetical protein